MTHGINLTYLPHSPTEIGLMIVSVIHLLTVSVKQVYHLAMKTLDAVRGIAKRFRLMRKELRPKRARARKKTALRRRVDHKGRLSAKGFAVNTRKVSRRRATRKGCNYGHVSKGNNTLN
jgi:hypothetical protein